jgi:hypothetical protein
MLSLAMIPFGAAMLHAKNKNVFLDKIAGSISFGNVFDSISICLVFLFCFFIVRKAFCCWYCNCNCICTRLSYIQNETLYTRIAKSELNIHSSISISSL